MQARTLRIIAGHGRLTELQKAGETECDVIALDVTDKEAKRLAVTLNRSGEQAEWDFLGLGQDLQGWQSEGFDLEDLGFSESYLDDLLAELGDAFLADQEVVPDPGAQMDRAAELQQKWGTALGQLWVIPSKTGKGEHRLLCGDSTKQEDVARVMEGEAASLMATDPPYGVSFAGQKYNPRAKDWGGIKNDDLRGDDLKIFILAMLKTWFPHIAEDSAFYLWTAAKHEGVVADAIRDSGLHIQSEIIWVKNCLVLGKADYHWRHENCWYAFWKDKQHRWFGGRDKTSVWEIDKLANSAYEHPMQKPAELYAIPMRHHTVVGDIVAEPFSGSGSQFVAAEQTGRLCRGIELEPKYVAVALERLAAMGLEPYRADAGPAVPKGRKRRPALTA